MSPDLRKISYTVLWNSGLIIVGSVLQAFALKAIGDTHGFVPGGLFGLSSLIYYVGGWLNPGWTYLLFNIPMFILGWMYISSRFLGYSLLAMTTLSVAFMLIDVQFNIANQLYAAVVYGVILGAGGGMVLRSLGSNGGLDVIAVIVHQRFNIAFGKFFFAFNALLFAASFIYLDNDLVIASLIAVFITATTIDYVLSLFNQRKMALIVSNQPETIVRRVQDNLRLGATLLPATGATSGAAKTVLLVVINNIQLKRLEEIVFTSDENALFIVENTFSVLGSTFAKRKVY
jgi:uncharacterized membrane-anchored protein YitT (DUF2179 family)